MKLLASVCLLLGLAIGQTAHADDCEEGARRCGDEGVVQACMSVAGSLYWTTLEQKCTPGQSAPKPPHVACQLNNRRCNDDGFEDICLADGDTTSWFKMDPPLDCR